jgi:hypothetical protein
MPIKKFGSALLICATLCLGLTGCIDSYFGMTMPDSLRQHGITASAKILDIWDTGWTVNDNPAIGMHVEVHPTDRPAFRATIDRYLVSRISLAQVQPGNTIQVRFDPSNPSVVAVDDQAADDGGASPEQMARIQGPDVVHLATYYDPPAIPPALRGLRVLVADRIVGDRAAGESDAQLNTGCMQSAAGLFGQIGWIMVRDPQEPQDLVARGECTASATFVTTDDGLYVLFPGGTGMRFETPQGVLVQQLLPTARSYKCPTDDQAQCGAVVGQYATAQLIGQIAASPSLRQYATRLGTGRR